MDYILVVDDEAQIARSTAQLLRELIDEPLDVLEAHSYDEAVRALARPGLVALVTDYRLGSAATGADLLRTSRELHPDATRLLMSADVCPAARELARMAGAAVLEKPFRPGELVTALLTRASPADAPRQDAT